MHRVNLLASGFRVMLRMKDLWVGLRVPGSWCRASRLQWSTAKAGLWQFRVVIFGGDRLKGLMFLIFGAPVS